MQNVTAVNFSPIVSRIAVDAAIHDALRQFVGRGKRYSVKVLANKSGVKDRCIEAAVAPVDGEDFRPLSRENLWSIMAVLGADFANHIMHLANLGAFDLPDEPLPRPAELVAESAQDHAQIAVAAADGKFCANDHGKLWSVGHDFIERGMQLVGLGKARRAAA
jgi:hypothetical protein